MKKILVIIAIIVLFLIWKHGKEKATIAGPSGDGIVDDKVLQIGSTGLDVRRLQMKLNEKIAYAVNESILISYSMDGINFFPITKPLVVDGVFGKATETALYALTAKKSIKASEIDSLTITPGA